MKKRSLRRKQKLKLPSLENMSSFRTKVSQTVSCQQLNLRKCLEQPINLHIKEKSNTSALNIRKLQIVPSSSSPKKQVNQIFFDKTQGRWAENRVKPHLLQPTSMRIKVPDVQKSTPVLLECRSTTAAANKQTRSMTTLSFRSSSVIRNTRNTLATPTADQESNLQLSSFGINLVPFENKSLSTNKLKLKTRSERKAAHSKSAHSFQRKHSLIPANMIFPDITVTKDSQEKVRIQPVKFEVQPIRKVVITTHGKKQNALGREQNAHGEKQNHSSEKSIWTGWLDDVIHEES